MGNPVSTSSFSQCRQVTGSTTSADLSITKTDSPDPVAPGGEITYTITVTNAGPNGAGDVVVGDFLPVGTTYIEGSCSSTGGGRCIGFGGLRGISFDSLGIGASETITLRARVNASVASGTLLTNRAVVGSGITPDPNSGNDIAFATTTTAAPSADLSITKTASPNPVAPGGEVTYTITVTNNGPSVTGDFVVNDTIPAITTFVSCAATGEGRCGTFGGTDINIFFRTLGVGASATITIVVIARMSEGITFFNTATVTPSVTPDPNVNNNLATVGLRQPHPHRPQHPRRRPLQRQRRSRHPRRPPTSRLSKLARRTRLRRTVTSPTPLPSQTTGRTPPPTFASKTSSLPGRYSTRAWRPRAASAVAWAIIAT